MWCATPPGPGDGSVHRGCGVEGEPRTRSCVLSGCLGSVYLALPTHMHTLSVSCHERGTLHFVDKESQKQLSKEKKKKKKKGTAQSPQRAKNRAVCSSVTEQHPRGDRRCLYLLRFFLLFPAWVHFHPRNPLEVKNQAGRPQPPGGRRSAGPSCRGSRPSAPLSPFLRRAGKGAGSSGRGAAPRSR